MIVKMTGAMILQNHSRKSSFVVEIENLSDGVACGKDTAERRGLGEKMEQREKNRHRDEHAEGLAGIEVHFHANKKADARSVPIDEPGFLPQVLPRCQTFGLDLLGYAHPGSPRDDRDVLLTIAPRQTRSFPDSPAVYRTGGNPR